VSSGTKNPISVGAVSCDEFDPGHKKTILKSVSEGYNLRIFAVATALIISSVILLFIDPCGHKLQIGTSVNTSIILILIFDMIYIYKELVILEYDWKILMQSASVSMILFLVGLSYEGTTYCIIHQLIFSVVWFPLNCFQFYFMLTVTKSAFRVNSNITRGLKKYVKFSDDRYITSNEAKSLDDQLSYILFECKYIQKFNKYMVFRTVFCFPIYCFILYTMSNALWEIQRDFFIIITTAYPFALLVISVNKVDRSIMEFESINSIKTNLRSKLFGFEISGIWIYSFLLWLLVLVVRKRRSCE
jgi:hypothetical protein